MGFEKATSKNSMEQAKAVSNLALEAMYLTKLNHPSILKIRGIALESSLLSQELQHDDFFILTDYVKETLDHRLSNWRKERRLVADSRSKSTTKEEKDNSKEKELQRAIWLLAKKTSYALQIISAIKYLHHHQILHGNVTPQNIGFTDNDEPKLFGFSHSRELPKEGVSTDPTATSTRTTPLSGTTSMHEEPKRNLNYMCSKRTFFGRPGEINSLLKRCENSKTRRYTAGELLAENSNSSSDCAVTLKADVYSWAMIFYETLTLIQPFATMKPGQHLRQVCMEAYRPCLKYKGIPGPICRLIKKAWEHDVSCRFDSTRVYIEMRKYCHALVVDIESGGTGSHSNTFETKASSTIKMRKTAATPQRQPGWGASRAA